MKRGTIIIVAIVALAGCIAAIYAWSEYDRGHADTATLKAAERIDARTLFEAYSTDETAADARFNGKVLEVTGTVTSISSPEATKGDGPGIVTVLLDTGDALASITCEFDADKAPDPSMKDRSITIKGKCTGYLMDVILVRCAIVEHSLP